MLTLSEIKQRLTDRRIAKVAEQTGLHYNTIREIRDNPEANPTLRVMVKLSEYLEVNE